MHIRKLLIASLQSVVCGFETATWPRGFDGGTNYFTCSAVCLIVIFNVASISVYNKTAIMLHDMITPHCWNINYPDCCLLWFF
jgi:hypothetical protein